MSAIARYFVQRGLPVAGYDRTPSSITDELGAIGVNIHFADDVHLIPPQFTVVANTLVIYTPAIPPNHSELNYFMSNGFMLVKRSQALGVIASTEQTVGIAGTHGKTSITTMVAHVLGSSALGCNAFLGGISKNYGSNLVLCDKGNRLLVVEADEFDRSFLTLHPYLAVVTSTDADHLDIYGTHLQVIEAFNQYAAQIKPGGVLVKKFGLDFNPQLAHGVSTITYGFDPQASVRPIDVEIIDGLFRFTAITPDGAIEGIELGVPGRYNLENALAAIAVATALEVSPNELRSSLKSFAGVVRRFDVQHRDQKVLYIDDYAHHPNEVSAMIDSVRGIYPGRAITGIFQPHLFTRTRDFADGFATALDKLDTPIILDIYPARESPIEGITSRTILDMMMNPRRLLMEKTQVLDWIAGADLDILLTMGAGDIDRLVPKIVEVLGGRNINL